MGIYNVVPNGQQGINLRHPALRSPIDGIVTNAGEGSAGRTAIRDADGVSHELLHTRRQYVSVGDRVVAGQMLGTMGNMGVDKKYVEGGDHHLHYQLIDAAGNRLDPQAYWKQREVPSPSKAISRGDSDRGLRLPAQVSWPALIRLRNDHPTQQTTKTGPRCGAGAPACPRVSERIHCPS
ncbi:M23 family metallopeptidase [Bradyrhizobium sp. WSM471]|uniref:M23 family metallopeptidase n=1 Tax=Bradyrhizobium sp. WSM471 TaxID=319017 RepID=UPI000A03C601